MAKQVKKESLRCQLGKHADGKKDSCPGYYYTPRGPQQGEHNCECECHARHIMPTLDELQNGE